MTGKASLLLVMGFSLMFLVFGNNFNSMSTRSVENFTDYHGKTVLHDLAVSGANIGANALFRNSNWNGGYHNLQMDGGTVDVNVEVFNASQNIKKITSVANYNGEVSRVEVLLAPSRFSKFAYYSVSEGNGIWWMNKDTVFGPFHTQDNLPVDNHPVFGVTGYRTTIKGTILYHDYYTSYNKIKPSSKASKTEITAYNNSVANDKPIFHGSFDEGIDEPLPTNGLAPLKTAAIDEGFLLPQSSTTTTHWHCTHSGSPHENSPTGCTKGVWQTTTTKDTVYVTFIQDSIKIKKGFNGVSTTYNGEDLAPNGVIYSEGMDVRLQGTVKGNYSVASDGNIYLDDDVVYSKDPRIYPNSTDLLGIIAKNSVFISDDGHNNNAVKNIKIQAAIYCENGGFGAQNYSTRSADGDINLLGGITQNIRGAVGTYSGNTIGTGYSKRYRYDKRLGTMFPPFYPVCGGFTIISWKE